MNSFTRSTIGAPATLKHERLKQWVAAVASLTQPARIHWADGSQLGNRLPRQFWLKGELLGLRLARGSKRADGFELAAL